MNISQNGGMEGEGGERREATVEDSVSEQDATFYPVT